MTTAIHFTGRVHSVIFENDAQSFYILRMKLDESGDFDRPVVVKGNVPGLSLSAGSWFGFEGKWVTHPEHGKQLEIVRAPVLEGKWTPEMAVRVLSSHGVGRISCQRIMDHFGEGTLNVLSEPKKLQEVEGIDHFSALHIASRWKSVRAMFQTLAFLGEFNLPKARIDQIWSAFGDEAESILATDPWAMVRIDGISFKQADEVAMKMGLDPQSNERIRGALLYTVKSRRGMGHLYLQSGELFDNLSSFVPDLTPQKVAEVLAQCHKKGLLVLDQKTKPSTTAIYEPWFHRIENESARLLKTRIPSATFTEGKRRTSYIQNLASVGPKTGEIAEAHPESLEKVARAAIEEWSSTSKLQLSPKQMEGAVNALVHPVSILTGLPGTGKTTTLRTLVKVLQDASVPFLLVAPTGIAAKRIMSVTGAEASTIHRAFQAKGMDMDDDRESTYAGVVGASSVSGNADGSDEDWGYDQHSPHPAQVVVCDEASMVDQHVMFRLLNCTSETCRLVFVGDAAQLPSVGPGNVMRDLVGSGHFPVVMLTDIYRQEDTSDIVIAAHEIYRGETPQSRQDFSLIEIREEEKILSTLLSTVRKLYSGHANFQVLSPRHAGTLGVTNLNSRIREILNPKSPGLQEMRLGSETIREGDRVMVVKNNYRFDIFNGDVGKIVNLDRKNKEVEIKIWGPPTVHVKLPFKDAPAHLRLAYCMTVHKSQGQEYDVILLPWVQGFGRQLQRNLLYTAITRAKKKAVLMGHVGALARAVANNREDLRNTLFPDRLSCPDESA